MCGRRIGKTECLVQKLVIKALENPGIYWWVCPDYKQSKPAKRMLTKYLEHSGIATYKAQEKEWYLFNGSIICWRTAENPKSLRGEGLLGCVMDEASQIKEEIYYEAILPALKDCHGFSYLASTPLGLSNWLYEHYMKVVDDPNWFVFNCPSWSNPNISEEELRKEIALIGLNRWNQEYMGHFTSASGALFNFQEVQNCKIESMREGYEKGIISVDLSLGYLTSDYQSVCYMGKSGQYYECDIWAGRTPVNTLAEIVKDYYYKYKPMGILVEVNGMQQLFADALVKVFSDVPPIVGINNSVKKETRIGRLSGPISRGELKIVQNQGGKLAIAQLSDWPDSRWDDIPDSIEMAYRFFYEGNI